MRFVPAVFLAAALGTACTVNVPLTGKRCAMTEPRCLPGFECVDDFCVPVGSAPGDGGAEDDAGFTCASDRDPLASACAGSDWFLAQNGNDANDGRSSATPRRTLMPASVNGGDRIHLLGRWTVDPQLASLSGTASCPVIITGEADGGTVLTAKNDLGGSNVVWTRMTVAPSGDLDSFELINAGRFITFHEVTFTGGPVTNGQYPYFIRLEPAARCDDCTVRNCTFLTGAQRVVTVDGSNFSFLGNRVVLREGPNIESGGANSRIEGNDFSGAFNDFVVRIDSGTVAFNVFHHIEVIFPNKVMLTATNARVTRNTFTQIEDDNPGAPLVEAMRFDNNLISAANRVVAGAPPPGGDWNVFSTDVPLPYFASDGGVFGTDRRASVDFEPGFVPLAGSVAIDGADPTLPVPQGGGLRGDVGAVERGAQRISTGTYCPP
ncbi:MAG: hypothetical protein JNM17_14010 [Archangium sp.]|nr:hypothetical protein [Archangium sp.]